MKICVIGYSGSGKSTFSAKIGKYYQVDTTHIDKLHFEAGWIERDPQLRNQMLLEVVLKNSWVIDGNYSRIVPERFLLADQIFIFKFNRFKCLYGAIRRRIKFRHKTRASMTEGNRERLSFEFMIWILFKSRTKQRRAFYKSLIRENPDKVIEFRQRKQVNDYLKSLQIFDFKAE